MSAAFHSVSFSSLEVDAVRAARLSAIQLHGEESPERVAALRRLGVELWKAVPVRTAADLAFLARHDDDPFARYEAIQQLMLDTLVAATIESSVLNVEGDGKLSIEEMQGGTFTITNGGIYGSLMSTPILNAPQSGILGMHRIEERPVVRAGKIEARPMMYLALSYDHRIVDGKEAVTFLVRVKEALEDPARLVLDL